MKYLKEISLPKRISVLSRFEADEMAEYIRDMDKEDRMAVIELLEDDLRKQVLLLHSFSEDEIGSKMTTNYIAVPSGISVRQAMSQLVRQAEENDNVSTIYVLDKKEMFRGAIDLKDLIIAREGTDLWIRLR